MLGEFFFMALAGIGVSLAGFAGLISALDKRADAHSAMAAWRIRNIVAGGFIITFAGFGTVGVFAIEAVDLDLTVRLISIFFVLANLARIRSEMRPGPAWPNESHRRQSIGFELVVIIALITNTVLARIGVLHILFLVQLMFPVSIFYRHIRDMASGEDGDAAV